MRLTAAAELNPSCSAIRLTKSFSRGERTNPKRSDLHI
jgi:hypothetical protein